MDDQVYRPASPTTRTAWNLRDQVGAPLHYPTRKRKRKAETTTTVTVDAELRLQAAHAANDGEAVTCFTNIHRSQKQMHEVCTSKRRRLNNPLTLQQTGGPRIRSRRGSVRVLIGLTPHDIARRGHTRQVVAPRRRRYPTTVPGPRATGSTHFIYSFSWGSSSPSVHPWCVFVYALAPKSSSISILTF